MNSLELLKTFIQRIKDDPRIGPSHISLYIAVFLTDTFQTEESLIFFNRNDIMRSARIYSRHTYNKCLNDLHDFGFLVYMPTTNAIDKSIVILKRSVSDFCLTSS